MNEATRLLVEALKMEVKRTKAKYVRERYESGLCLLCDEPAHTRGLCLKCKGRFYYDRRGAKNKLEFESKRIYEGEVLPEHYGAQLRAEAC